MLGNCEKMLLISSPPPNEWPQNINQIDDPKSTLNNNNPNMASLAATITTPTGVGERIMDQKAANIAHQDQQKQQHQLPQDQAVRCPRCDSTNTKFCYYNNYSLTQPRHFCKACKRYWTKGGTLRNVPVGGGCRKNKRVKRPSNNSSSSSNTTSLNNTATNYNNSASLEGSVNSSTSSIAGGCGLSSLSSSPGGPIHDLLSSASNHHQSPLFYGFPTSNINFPFSRYDLQNPPQINGLGLGFSSGLVHNMNSMNIHHSNDNNNNNNNKQMFQDMISSNPLLSNYATTTTTTTTTTATTTTTTPPTISSLLGSSLHQMKGGNNNNNNNNFQTLLPSYEDDLHIKGSGHNGMYMKGVKMEFQGQNRSFDNNHWDTNTNTNTTISAQNQMDQHHRPMGSSSDPSILWGNSNGGINNLGAWLDPTNNLGSSVPSLI